MRYKARSVKRLTNKQSNLLAQYYDKWRWIIKKMCLGYIRALPEESLDDLMQYCWEQVCIKAHTANDISNIPATWLKKVCVSTLSDLIEYYRRNKRSSMQHAIFNIDEVPENQLYYQHGLGYMRYSSQIEELYNAQRNKATE